MSLNKRARTVECRFLNPHCLVLKSLLELKKSSNRLYITFSNTLAVEGKTGSIFIKILSLSIFIKRRYLANFKIIQKNVLKLRNN